MLMKPCLIRNEYLSGKLFERNNLRLATRRKKEEMLGVELKTLQKRQGRIYFVLANKQAPA